MHRYVLPNHGHLLHKLVYFFHTKSWILIILWYIDPDKKTNPNINIRSRFGLSFISILMHHYELTINKVLVINCWIKMFQTYFHKYAEILNWNVSKSNENDHIFLNEKLSSKLFTSKIISRFCLIKINVYLKKRSCFFYFIFILIYYFVKFRW